ncbi:MAG: carboxypeptidase regulatory-like domain-containing protein [Candidatus Tectomicrobia bacterium]|nr:carboxypeptidase regulatory-like domain-containing protein [Candidatus Tectomicrobia bacterium]
MRQRALRRGLVLLVLVASLGAARLAQAQSPVTISGFVLGRDVAGEGSGRPLAGATVTIGDLSATTDESGLYRIENVPTGTFTVVVQVSGFNRGEAVRTINPGDIPPSIDFTLNPLSTGDITGIVSNAASNAPIGGVLVTLGERRATTDAEGLYTFTDVEPATNLAITFLAEGFTTRTLSVDVRLGQVSRLDVALQAVRTTALVTGVVRHAQTGEPLPEVLIQAGTVRERSLGTGEFRVEEIAPGPLSIIFSKDNFITERVELTLEAGSTSQLFISLRPVAENRTLQGRVTARSTGLPVEGARVRVGDVVALTNSSGAYTVNEIKTTLALATAEADGFLPKTSGIQFTSNQGTLNFALDPQIDRLIILSAGFGFSPVLLNDDGSGTVTLVAEVRGGVPPLAVEATYEVATPLGLTVPTPLGQLTDADGDGSYLLSIEVFPEGALPPGPLTIPGLAITATDAVGNEAHFPALDVPGSQPAARAATASAPEVELPQPTRPLITMAGFSTSPLTFEVGGGGELTLQAQVLGGVAPLRVTAAFVSLNPFGRPIEAILGTMLGPDDSGVYRLRFPVRSTQNLVAGVNSMRGLLIRGVDADGNVSLWPDPAIPRSNAGYAVPGRRQPAVPVSAESSPVPLILMAGFGGTTAQLSADEGGELSLWALAAGGQGSLRVTGHTDILGFEEIELTASGEGFLYEFRVPNLAAQSFTEGLFHLPGLRIIATDEAGETAEWPNLRLFRRLPEPTARSAPDSSTLTPAEQGGETPGSNN